MVLRMVKKAMNIPNLKLENQAFMTIRMVASKKTFDNSTPGISCHAKPATATEDKISKIYE
jgi:hypothetical protein